eukprot:4495610-Pyramimonas_sp.AAC.1
MIAGNVCVDTLAGAAAKEARLPESERTRVVQVENEARLVRMRLLRIALQTGIGANKRRRTEAPAVPPPHPRGV